MIYGNVELFNIEELIPVQNGSGFRLSRISSSLRDKLNAGAQKAAFFSCGCEIRFLLKGEKAVIRMRRECVDSLSGTGVAEIYYGDFQADYKVTPCYITGAVTEIIVPKPENLELLKEISANKKLRYNPEMVRILLPYDAGNILVSVEGDVEPPGSSDVPARRYLAYGSSITHGGSAVRPAGTYAMKTAAALGVDLVNLGFAGSAHMEPEIADYIAVRNDWDFATLEMGVNVMSSWSTEMFHDRISYFIEKIAALNKEKWIFCIDLFLNDSYWDNREKLHQFKRIIKSKVVSMNQPKLVYIPGEELLTKWQGLSSDLIHPTEEGFHEICYNLADIIRHYDRTGGELYV